MSAGIMLVFTPLCRCGNSEARQAGLRYSRRGTEAALEPLDKKEATRPNKNIEKIQCLGRQVWPEDCGKS